MTLSSKENSRGRLGGKNNVGLSVAGFIVRADVVMVLWETGIILGEDTPVTVCEITIMLASSTQNLGSSWAQRDLRYPADKCGCYHISM
jgi:hypothetical protein